jgi:hypothetical protein
MEQTREGLAKQYPELPEDFPFEEFLEGTRISPDETGLSALNTCVGFYRHYSDLLIQRLRKLYSSEEELQEFLQTANKAAKEAACEDVLSGEH